MCEYQIETVLRSENVAYKELRQISSSVTLERGHAKISRTLQEINQPLGQTFSFFKIVLFFN